MLSHFETPRVKNIQITKVIGLLWPMGQQEIPRGHVKCQGNWASLTQRATGNPLHTYLSHLSHARKRVLYGFPCQSIKKKKVS